MSSIGEHLKQIRQAKGLSVEDLSKISKINLRFLHAMEEEDFKLLPGGVFNRGFIKSYAHSCGANETELLGEYENAVRAQKGPELNLVPVEPPAISPWPANRSFVYAVAGVILIALIAVGMFYYYQSRGEDSDANANSNSMGAPPSAASPAAGSPSSLESQSTTVPAVLPPPPSNEDSTPAGSTKGSSPRVEQKRTIGEKPLEASSENSGAGNMAANSATPGSGGVLSLRLVANENTWLSIRRDGKEIYRKIMRPSESLSLTANDKFDIVCGNAAGVSVTLDGKPQPPLGKEGEVKFVTFRRPASVAPPQP